MCVFSDVQAAAKLSAHREYISSKLAALGKFSARLEAAGAWAAAARADLEATRASDSPQRDLHLGQITVGVGTCSPAWVGPIYK